MAAHIGFSKSSATIPNRRGTTSQQNSHHWWVHHYKPEPKRLWNGNMLIPVKKNSEARGVQGKWCWLFWDVRGPLTIDFLEKEHTVENVRKDIRSKRRHQLYVREMILLQDNARPGTANKTVEKIEKIGWELLKHPYSPDLAPSDLNLSGPLKGHLCGMRFPSQPAVVCHRNTETPSSLGEVYWEEWRLCGKIKKQHILSKL